MRKFTKEDRFKRKASEQLLVCLDLGLGGLGRAALGAHQRPELCCAGLSCGHLCAQVGCGLCQHLVFLWFVCDQLSFPVCAVCLGGVWAPSRGCGADMDRSACTQRVPGEGGEGLFRNGPHSCHSEQAGGRPSSEGALWAMGSVLHRVLSTVVMGEGWWL